MYWKGEQASLQIILAYNMHINNDLVTLTHFSTIPFPQGSSAGVTNPIQVSTLHTCEVATKSSFFSYFSFRGAFVKFVKTIMHQPPASGMVQSLVMILQKVYGRLQKTFCSLVPNTVGQEIGHVCHVVHFLWIDHRSEL